MTNHMLKIVIESLDILVDNIATNDPNTKQKKALTLIRKALKILLESGVKS
jgi:hypothetical protein